MPDAHRALLPDIAPAAGAPAGADLSCPSARAEPGALLIGVLGDDGLVQPIPTRLPVTAEFIEQASRHGPPEARFRFAGRCVKGGCSQWTGNSCGVIEKVLTGMAAQSLPPQALPRCAIRGTCRWYAERGAAACHACAYVVTDQRAVEGAAVP